MSRVIAIGDTHSPCMRPGFVEFLKRIRDAWKVDTAIHLGDYVDWASISYHDKDSRYPSAEQEVSEARKQIREIHRNFPDMTVLSGNHDWLPERRLDQMAMPKSLLKDPADFWQVPGWDIRERFDTHVIDGVIYSHGDSGKTGRWAASRNALENFASYCQGHLHTQAGVSWHANRGARIFACQNPCGVDQRRHEMSYARRYSARCLIGCSVIIDGEFACNELMDLNK